MTRALRTEAMLVRAPSERSSRVPRLAARCRLWRASPGLAGTLAWLFLLLPTGGGEPFFGRGSALASALSLRRELREFQASERSDGLAFCVVFLPLESPPVAGTEAGKDRARHRSKEDPSAGPMDGPEDDPRNAPRDDSKAVARSGGNQTPRGGVWINAEEPLVPASLAKLTTTIFAQDVLGSDFTFHTRFLAAGELVSDTLRGDLVLAGGGDPFLVSERLWLLAQALRGTGLRHVTGGLMIDSSWMAPDSTDPARSIDREFSDRPYAAKLSALAVNFNAAAVRVRPAPTAGMPAAVDLDPLPCGYLRLSSTLRTVGAEEPEAWTVTLEPDSSGETIRVDGAIRVGSPPAVEYRSVRDPERFSAALVRSFIEAAGISIAGPTRADAAPDSARVLADFPSLPLRDLVDAANRFSNNFMADQIALALSALADSNGRVPITTAEPRPASLTEAGKMLTRRLRAEFGAGASVTQLDGSGLSTGNRMTGEVLARLLERAWTDLRIGPEIAASLPMPGGDGTLRKRFGEGPAAVLRAKTGTMSTPAASGMAGYLEAGGPAPVAFVLLMNGRAAAWDLARMRALQEEWIREYLRE